MAEAVKRGSYDPYRNISYAYDGSAARVLEPETTAKPRTRTHVRPRQEELTRPKVRTREAGKVAPFAVCGFAAVAVLAVFMLLSFVQLSSISQQVVELNSELTALKSEEATLRARYELAYDLRSIETTLTSDGSMSRPQTGQIVYVDLTAPDSVVVYGETDSGTSFLESAKEIVNNILAYF